MGKEVSRGGGRIHGSTGPWVVLEVTLWGVSVESRRWMDTNERSHRSALKSQKEQPPGQVGQIWGLVGGASRHSGVVVGG